MLTAIPLLLSLHGATPTELPPPRAPVRVELPWLDEAPPAEIRPKRLRLPLRLRVSLGPAGETVVRVGRRVGVVWRVRF